MDKKIRLALNLFFSNKSNSGIVNYIYNIISALKTLPAEKQPSITVYHSTDAPIDYVKEIGYSDIEFILFKPYSSFKIVNGLNKIFYKATNINLYINNYFKKIDVLYPYFEFKDKAFSGIKNKIHWLVDFNNMAYPSHYIDGGKSIIEYQQKLTSTTEHIALSSESLLKELSRYYPEYKNKVSILRFACTLPDLSHIDNSKLREKFNIKMPYFMSPNQFWEHKNQLIVVEAMNALKVTGNLNFQVAFTGSMEVNRGKGHMVEKLLDAVKDYKLEDNVMFLGIVDRDEQLALMKNALALIQPSLYEGWSTLVEEAKALNQKIILSDIPVHREQKCDNSFFFNPLSADELANQILNVRNNPDMINIIDYSDNVRKFGQDFIIMLNKELKNNN